MGVEEAIARLGCFSKSLLAPEVGYIEFHSLAASFWHLYREKCGRTKL